MIYAIIALFVSATTVTWWIVGDQTDPEAKLLGLPLDYVIRPPDLSATQEQIIGIAATIVLAASLAVLVGAVLRRRADPLWLLAVVPLSLAAVIAGTCWRIFTAGVIGANVGVGLLTLFVLPIAAVMLLLTALVLIAIHRRKSLRSYG
ncbi:hypothetical protein ACTI_40690 [Actinoplanes sp. OR16]|uniref:hypothetical protein n=1 Tax=Actinoplanes sp. OR16 TaxID=946334 RepID=UPI000F6E3A56|nr:hypothetical protein [Actinoplanes sp. OR16]BBH67384.1 hypothetical protein ACTI_40690 [Actinoplanes sp. OR16]